MKKLINKVKTFLHIHRYNKPIASMYISFHGRDIIYECSCGKRKLERVHRSFSTPFPIETTIGMSYKDIERILAGGPVNPFENL
jgi:hypothetical protein